MAIIAAKGALAVGMNIIESTAYPRWLRTTVFNGDTVAHDVTFVVGGTAIKKRNIEAGKDYTFPFVAVVANNALVLEMATAIGTTAPTYAVSGTY